MANDPKDCEQKTIIRPNREAELRNLNEVFQFPGRGVRGEKSDDKSGGGGGEGAKRDILTAPQPIVVDKTRKDD